MKILTIPEIKTRKQRSVWLSKHFGYLFKKTKILDVGCDEAPLRKLVGKQNYTGIDFIGNPDLKINLEEIKKLPFKAQAFDTVICIEVLEHLDNLHLISKDIFRVSGNNVLISLPNAWRDARVKIRRGKGSIAHYGLPLEKPLDRHKWFFTTQEAIDFLKSIKPNNYELKITLTQPKRNFLIAFYRQLRYSSLAYQNKFCQTIWAEYKKIK